MTAFGSPRAAAATTIRRVIRLREAIDRGLRHRWLGPLVVLLLVLLVLGLAFHEGGETLFEAGGQLCVALALIVVAALLVRRPFVRRTCRLQPRRGPPLALVPVARTVSASFAPLRL